MKYIPLTNDSRLAIVDEEVYEELSKFKWCSAKGSGSYTSKLNNYAMKTSSPQISMHRLVMKAPKGTIVDHINHNTLDNRRANLRFVTASQNQLNLKKKSK